MREIVLSDFERDLLRQWYNVVEDFAPEYMIERDRQLARKLGIPTTAAERREWRRKMGGDGNHVYKGEPDARQSNKIDHPVSRFRPTYRALTDDEKKLHDEIKNKAVELEDLIERAATMSGGRTPPSGDGGRYKSLAITSLEQSIMWAVKALTS